MESSSVKHSQRKCPRPHWGVGVLALLALSLGVGRAIAAPCTVDTIGIDWPLANNVSTPILGEQPGQTFTAPESLMTFLRVWRHASNDSNIIGMKLCLTATAPDGTPDLKQILYCGPTVVHFRSDHVHPTEFRWDFDPPFVLPYRGKFAFFILEDPCMGRWDMLASENPPLYPGGEMWYTSRSNCILGPLLQAGLISYFEYDHVFQAGFCKDAPTAALRKSWGRLKMLYR